jgi:hypothetical protein
MRSAGRRGHDRQEGDCRPSPASTTRNAAFNQPARRQGEDGAAAPRSHACGLSLGDLPDDADISAHFTLVYFGQATGAKTASRVQAQAGWAGYPRNAV